MLVFLYLTIHFWVGVPICEGLKTCTIWLSDFTRTRVLNTKSYITLSLSSLMVVALLSCTTEQWTLYGAWFLCSHVLPASSSVQGLKNVFLKEGWKNVNLIKLCSWLTLYWVLQTLGHQTNFFIFYLNSNHSLLCLHM